MLFILNENEANAFGDAVITRKANEVEKQVRR